jgi:hypothetical protein
MTTTLDGVPWRRQSDALNDLSTFLTEHAPGTDHPLPLLRWRVGRSGWVYGEVHDLDIEPPDGRRDPRAVIRSCADALATNVEERPEENQVLLVVRGRIGLPESSGGVRRTRIRISTRVPAANRHRVGGSAFVP